MKDDSTLITRRDKATSSPRSHTRYLIQAIQLEEAGVNPIVNLAIFTIALFFGAAVAWASVTPITETATAIGEVVPSANIYEVKHLQGGTVSNLYIRNGATVKKDELLLKFSLLASHAELERMLTRQASMQLQQARFQALLENQEPDYTKVKDEYRHLIATQDTIYTAQIHSQNSELSVIDSQIAQRKQELKRQKQQVYSLRKEVKLAEQQASIRRQLVKKGAVSRSDLLATLSKLAEVQNRMGQANGSISVAQSAVAESEQRYKEAKARFAKDIELEAGEVVAELAELDQQIISLRDKVNRLEVRAPVAGIVQDLSVSGPGAVIEPGELLLKIVPIGDELIVEAKVRPEDIGHVHVGLKAEVKVTSYDSARFGSIDGVLRQISPSTYLDDEHKPYYRAEIGLSQPFLGDDPTKLQILPGMQIQANIRTGEKTIMEYLMKPVTRGFNESFRER